MHQYRGDWRTKAKELNVPVSTAYRWVSVGKVTDGRGGKMYERCTEEHRNYMATLVEGMFNYFLKQFCYDLKIKLNLFDKIKLLNTCA